MAPGRRNEPGTGPVGRGGQRGQKRPKGGETRRMPSAKSAGRSSQSWPAGGSKGAAKGSSSSGCLVLIVGPLLALLALSYGAAHLLLA